MGFKNKKSEGCGADSGRFFFTRSPAVFVLPTDFRVIPHFEGPRPCWAYSAAYCLFCCLLWFLFTRSPAVFSLSIDFPVVPGSEGPRLCWAYSTAYCLFCCLLGTCQTAELLFRRSWAPEVCAPSLIGLRGGGLPARRDCWMAGLPGGLGCLDAGVMRFRGSGMVGWCVAGVLASRVLKFLGF